MKTLATATKIMITTDIDPAAFVVHLLLAVVQVLWSLVHSADPHLHLSVPVTEMSPSAHAGHAVHVPLDLVHFLWPLVQSAPDPHLHLSVPVTEMSPSSH